MVKKNMHIDTNLKTKSSTLTWQISQNQGREPTYWKTDIQRTSKVSYGALPSVHVLQWVDLQALEGAQRAKRKQMAIPEY